jgi:diguanylate cyclase
MYQAKRSGRSLVCYRSTVDPADRDRLALAGQLPVAVAERQFVLHFQPVVELGSGEVRGAEALARWRHPTRGQLEPRWFLDLLERSNQLGEFTAAVLDDALAAAELWSAAGFDLSVSVNVSARSLLDVGLPRMVAEALAAHPVPPSRLCLELTETLAISQLDTVDRVLRELCDLGVRLALDDFGTGYSSLAALARVPVHQLKIDRSFVDAAYSWSGDVPDISGHGRVSQATAVIRSTVQLGRALDLLVVGEGVENHAQRQLLWDLGCTHGQGHLFARPTPAPALVAVLRHGVNGTPGTLAAPLPEGGRVVRIPKPRKGQQAAPRRRSER